jgi:hypothetical protein
MSLDGPTTDELRQAVERLRKEVAELRGKLEVAIAACRRTRETVRRQSEEMQQVVADNVSPDGAGAPTEE